MAYYATYMPNELGELQKVVINAGIGFCLPFYGETAPPGTLACDGSEISREAYKELFQVLGTKAGAGDGVSTFNLPDFRGRFIRATGGNAAALGAEQEDAIREISGQFLIRSWDGVREDGTNGWAIGATNGAFELKADAESKGHVIEGDSNTLAPYQTIGFRASNAVPTAAENRPVNVALLWCIIYE